MNNRIRESFDQIHAEEELKIRTKKYLKNKVYLKKKHHRHKYRKVMAAAACIAVSLLTLGGCGVYFTPTSVISIDVNPSLEMDVNCFDQVISVEGLNDDGVQVADSLNLRFKNYTEAISKILSDEKITECMDADGEMSIVIIGENQKQKERLLENIEVCTAEQKNIYCSTAGNEEAQDAREAGLSYGKYKKYLELKELNSQITIEEVELMTMKEIQIEIQRLKSDMDNSTEEKQEEFSSDNGEKGKQNQYQKQNNQNK